MYLISGTDIVVNFHQSAEMIKRNNRKYPKMTFESCNALATDNY